MSTEINKGCVVMSLAGRDKGHFFIVLDVRDNYAYIIDGKLRRTESPKKKKIKHLKYSGKVSDDRLLYKISEKILPENIEVRKVVNLFLTEEETL